MFKDILDIYEEGFPKIQKIRKNYITLRKIKCRTSN